MPDAEPDQEPTSEVDQEQAAGDQDEASEEDQRRQFREALDRKHKQAQDGIGGDPANAGKVHETHGPAGSRRSFRRKSG